MKKVLLPVFLLSSIGTQAQTANPFKSIGKEAEIVTLSGGRYEETFDADPLQRIGSVVIDTHTGTITQLLDADSMSDAGADNSMASRWTSIDPLAAKYPSFSPYAFCANNPILYKDVDGREFVVGDGGKPTKADHAFFEILNARSGGIFQMDKHGVVNFAEGKSLADVQNSKDVSAGLAKAVAAGIGPDVQTVNFRAVKKTADVNFDQFSSGKVDVADLQGVDNSMQAALIGHFVTERFATDGYEKNKKEIGAAWNALQASGDVEGQKNSAFYKAHSAGITTETSIITETTGYETNGTRDELLNVDPSGMQYFEYGKGTEFKYMQASDGTISGGTIHKTE